MLAPGWAQMAAHAPRTPTYRHSSSGNTSSLQDGRPLQLVCTGRGDVSVLANHPKTTLGQCVYWNGRGIAEVPPEGLELVFSAPHRVLVPPCTYTLISLESCIHELVAKQLHATTHEEHGGPARIFRFVKVSSTSCANRLPPGWTMRKCESSHVPNICTPSVHVCAARVFIHVDAHVHPLIVYLNVFRISKFFPRKAYTNTYPNKITMCGHVCHTYSLP
jgi:hypothetical protein